MKYFNERMEEINEYDDEFEEKDYDKLEDENDIDLYDDDWDDDDEDMQEMMFRFARLLDGDYDELDEEYDEEFFDETDIRELEEKYEAQCNEMQDKINDLEKELEDEKRNHATKTEHAVKAIEKKMDKLALNYEREMAATNKTLEKKDTEIAELKKKLEIQEEYIELISAPKEPGIESKVNIPLLQGKRYIFVGRLDCVSELKHVFPNSVFMDTEQKSLDGIKVDAVVLLIKYMSHSMYYKIKNTASFTDLPIIYCNATSLHTIYKEMALVAA